MWEHDCGGCGYSAYSPTPLSLFPPVVLSDQLDTEECIVEGKSDNERYGSSHDTSQGKILTERSREKVQSNVYKSSSQESDREGSIRDMNIKDNRSRINCILSVDSNTILMGSHTGVIYVYDGNRNLKNKLPALPSSILSMLHFQ